MKQSKTAIKELSNQYRVALRKCALPCALMASLSLAAPANAARIVVGGGAPVIIVDGISGQTGPHGGAIEASNGKDVTINSGLEFDDNTSLESGGVIYMDSAVGSGKLTIKDGVKFRDNVAASRGGVLYLDGVNVNIENGVEFSGNTSTSSGGAIYVWNNFDPAAITQIGDDVIFSNNTALANGGAITSFDGIINIGDNALFSGNRGLNGGAIHNSNWGGVAFLNIANGAKFVGNKATGAFGFGGAINNTGDLTIGDDAEFSLNEAYAGGAIFSSSGSLEIGDDALFGGNTATGDAGGAIYARNGDLIIGNGARFIGNQSNGVAPGVGAGGAMYLEYMNTDIGANALFDGNSASVGGAIANGGSDVTIGDGAIFRNNTASGDGGAIHNWGDMLFTGDVLFENNYAGGILNDIENGGLLAFENGTVSFDGGISGTGDIAFTNVDLVVKYGTTVIQGGTIDLSGGNNNLFLNVGGGLYGRGLQLFDVDNFVGDFDSVDTFGGKHNLVYLGNGQFDMFVNAGAIGANANQQAIINGLIGGDKSGHAAFDAMWDNIMDMLHHDDDAVVAAGLLAVSGYGPSAAPKIQHVSNSHAVQVFDAVGTRFAGGVATRGMASGDFKRGEISIWAQGLANDARLRGENGFDAKSWGVAGGLESNVTTSTKLGIGYAHTNTKVTPTSRETKIQSNSVLAYAEYKPMEWFINGIASYTFSNYDEDRNIGGTILNSEHSVNTFAMQAVTGYELMPTKNLALVPQFGARYINVDNLGFWDS
ncbi:MAG: autotransporter domain-containing protein, partial [Alphaproteobacteria bacterium]|nr:autotransporter domain-containing protein [Alphaproteobacteria bacterium]